MGTISKRSFQIWNSENFKNLITKIVEKPSPVKAPSNLFIVGRYIFDNRIFDFISSSKKSPKEMELTDSIQKFIISNNKVAFLKLEGEFYDCGDKFGY